jgi:hypothetical protein
MRTGKGIPKYRLPMSEVTRILSAIERGEPQAADQLLPLIYDELRKLAAQKFAQEKPGQTLQATALVHEAYLRLVFNQADAQATANWNSRGHFFAAAAEAMRRILVESARRESRLRHGGDLQRHDVDAFDLASPPTPDELAHRPGTAPTLGLPSAHQAPSGTLLLQFLDKRLEIRPCAQRIEVGVDSHMVDFVHACRDGLAQEVHGLVGQGQALGRCHS